MTAVLENARPKPTPAVEDGEFVDFGWRPIFKEHINRERTRFGREAMERIADRCNERIADSQDFCPICIRHTTDDGSRDPEVIGYYGPFRAQKLPSGKWAVYARERIYTEDAHKRKKYPRVSVEYWADKDDPTGGYFDPASLLGAETPELDLGIHYSADPEDPSRTLMRYQRVTRYEAECGGSNTYAPSNDDEKKTAYQSGGTLSPGDLQQIINALAPTIKQSVDEAVAAMNPVGSDPDNLLSPEGADADEPVAGPLDDEPGLDDSDLAEASDETPIDEGGTQFADAIDDLEDGPDDGSPSKEPETSDAIADLKDGPDDSDQPPKKKKPAKFQKAETLDPEDLTMAQETSEQTVARYQKEAADYKKKADDTAKELGELKTKYQKEVEARREAETNHSALAERVAKIEASERRAVRYQKLGELQNKGYTFDLDDEIKDCEEMTEPQFDRHLERIAAKYQRVPTGLGHGLKIAGPSRTDSDDRRDQRKRDRYSKVASENCQKANNAAGKKVLDFQPEFERLMKEDPEKISVGAA